MIKSVGISYFQFGKVFELCKNQNENKPGLSYRAGLSIESESEDIENCLTLIARVENVLN